MGSDLISSVPTKELLYSTTQQCILGERNHCGDAVILTGIRSKTETLLNQTTLMTFKAEMRNGSMCMEKQ